MRNLHYRVISFRLNEKTLDNLRKFKKDTDQTWNLLFMDLIKTYERRRAKESKEQGTGPQGKKGM